MTNELKVGLAVLAAALILFFGIRFLSGQSAFGGGYDVVALFDDAQGLTRGSVVRMNGVQIGAVRDVQLSPDARHVLVTLGIDEGVEIPRGSTIGSRGISALGDVSVGITPPPGAGAGRPLVADDTLIARPTPDLYDLIAGESTSLTARADTALTQAISVFTTLDEVLATSTGDLRDVLAQLNFLTRAATRTLLNEQERISQTLGALGRAAQGAEQFSTDLSVLSTDLQDATGSFRDLAVENSDSLQVTITQLNTTLRSLDRSLASLEGLTTDLDTTLSKINSPEGSLGLLLDDPSLYYNANAAAASLQQVLQDLQNNPQRYTKDLKVVDIF